MSIQEKLNRHPSVTIILPIRNESAFIERGLHAILSQDYPAKCIEILIADGMSTDNTRTIIQDIASLHPQVPIHILNNPRNIVPTGINIALRQAKGEIIIRVDGHTIIAPDYVRRCVEILQRTKADNVGGKMAAIGRNRFGRALALATSTPFGVGGARFHYSDEEEWVDTVYMGSWTRGVFQKIGLFDEELVRDQDDEFNYRLREQGGRILLSPVIRSEYEVRSKPIALWRQYFQYGFWKIRVLQKHPRQMRFRQFVPPLFAGSLIGSAILNILSKDIIPLVTIFILYSTSNLLASIWTVYRKKTWRLLPLLPVVFSILHLSYGLGFLAGLVKFWNRWSDKKGKVPEFKPLNA